MTQWIKRFILLVLFVCLAGETFSAEPYSRTMRIGESQYFDVDGIPGQDLKIRLISVQNGVAVLEKEDLRKHVTEVQYFYAAQGNAEAVAPILLQPYPAQVTTENILFSGISEAGLELRLYQGSSTDFSSANWVENAEFSRNGSSFSVSVPLNLGSNLFFVSYAPGIIGARAIAAIERIELSGALLNADLDPIGSSDIRVTALNIENASLGVMNAIETILGAEQSRTQTQWNVSASRFEIDNTQTQASERSFHLSFLGSEGSVQSRQTIVIPVDDVFPVVHEMDSFLRLTPGGSSVSGNFEDNLGVRFVWMRLSDAAGMEVARAYAETGKLSEGSLHIDFPDVRTMTLKVYAADGGALNSAALELPREELLKGRKYTLETGVTDIAGNRSAVKTYEISAFTGHKEWNISLVDAIPRGDVQAYPLLVRITEDDMDFSAASPSGADLRFLDENGENLLFEVERFDAKKNIAEVWVRIPRIAAGTAFIRLDMLWGSMEAEHAGTSFSVWDDAFRGVYHFNEKYMGPYIPEADYTDYTIYATGDAVFRERTKIYGVIAASGVLRFGMDSRVEGDALAGLAIYKDERAVIIGKSTEGNLNPLKMVIEPQPQAGSRDIVVSSNSSAALLPGKYQDLTLGAGSTVKLSSGTYHFRNVNFSQDAIIDADISRGVIVMKVSGNLNVAERSQVVLKGNTRASMFRCDVAASNVFFGMDVKWKGIVTAPNAVVHVGERMAWIGALYAHDIITGTDVVFMPDLPAARYPTIPVDDEMFPPATIAGFALFATENVVLQNNSQVKGRIGSNGSLSLGYDSRLYGDAWVLQNLSLGSQSTLTGSVLLGGSLQENANVNWAGSVTPILETGNYKIPEVNVNLGTESIVVRNDQVYSLLPGSYGSLIIQSRGTLQMSSGLYHFANIQVENDGIVSAEMSQGAIEVRVAGNGYFGDRSRFIRSGSECFGDLRFFFSGSGLIRYGNDIQFKGAVRAPDAEVILGDRNVYTGSLWARRIEVKSGSSFLSENSVSMGNENTDIEFTYASDWILDATRFRYHGSNVSSVSKEGFIAESQHLKTSSRIELSSGEYTRNNQGTWSCWLRFDGISGRILSSADVAIPNWEWRRTAEGNVIVRIGSLSLSLPVPENVWILLSVVQGDNTMSVYLNGSLQARGSVGNLNSIAKPWLGSYTGAMEFDEFRVSETARSEDWIRLDYHTQKRPDNEIEPIMEFARSK